MFIHQHLPKSTKQNCCCTFSYKTHYNTLLFTGFQWQCFTQPSGTFTLCVVSPSLLTLGLVCPPRPEVHSVCGGPLTSATAGRFSRGTRPSCPSPACGTASPSRTWRTARGPPAAPPPLWVCFSHSFPHPEPPRGAAGTSGLAWVSSTNTRPLASSSGDAPTRGRWPAGPG